MVFRTCWGLMNSTLGVVKTYIGEMCNDRLLARGFAIISAMGGLARFVLSPSLTRSIFGPLAGGFLSKPEDNFPGLVRLMPWLRKVRYWIPCFVGGLFCFITALVTAFTAPETNLRSAALQAKKEKEENKERVAEIEKKAKKGETLTNEETMLLELSHGSYYYLLRNKLVMITTILYGTHNVWG